MVAPAARRSSTSLIRIRNPRTQGHPPHWLSSRVMRWSLLIGVTSPAIAILPYNRACRDARRVEHDRRWNRVMDVRPIRTNEDLDWALAEVGCYFDEPPAPGSPEADRFDVPSILISVYEESRFPIP